MKKLTLCIKSLWTLFLLFSLSLLTSSNLNAQQSNYGTAPYFITDPKFNCAAFQGRLNGLPRYGISFLWNTPGGATDCLAKTLQDPRLSFIEAIAVNETCVSRGDCGSYESLRGYSTASLISAVSKGDPKVQAAYTNAARSVCQFVESKLGAAAVRKTINPSLETHLPRNLWSKVAVWVQGACPGWEIVWNPVGPKPGLPQPPAVLSEGHGPSPSFADNRCIANPDGSVIASGDWEGFLRHYPQCTQVFSWTPNDNCIAPGQPKMDPRARPCKVTDNTEAIRKAALAILVPPQPVPDWTSDDRLAFNGCNKVLRNPDGLGGFVWKESETKKTPQGKPAAVTLLPAGLGLDSSTKRVSVLKGSQVLDNLTFVYLYTPDKSNRPVWLGHKAPTDYPFNVVVKGKGPKGTFCWGVSNPHIRND
jgi:hypothetical protein